ncbi:short chain dehydrogenase, partial [Mycobacterium sp. ITM-2017-0098]
KGRAVVPGWPWWPLVEVMKVMPPRFTKYFA